jgi:hypothetical protein
MTTCVVPDGCLNMDGTEVHERTAFQQDSK